MFHAYALLFRDSVYVAASNVVKNRLVADDLFVYKVNDSSVALSPQDRKLEPCEIIGLLMLIYKGKSASFQDNFDENPKKNPLF